MSVVLQNEKVDRMLAREGRISSPYPGLVPYSEDEAKLFFGRKTETQLVVANLFAARLTLFYAESGVGKSSVLQAGVLPTLKSTPRALGVYFNKWKGNSCANLKATVAEAAAHVFDGALNQDLALDEYLVVVSQALKSRVFIILDQFEEYFLYHPEGEADEFFEAFPAAIGTDRAPLGFVVSLREDALSLLDRFEGSIPTLFDNYLRIKHLDRESARAAIVEPLAVYNHQLGEGVPQASCEPELVALILNDLSRKTREAEALVAPEQTTPTGQLTSTKDLRIKAPYLQLVMTRLWAEAARTPPPAMRVATYRKLGGVEKIINKHLDKSMRALTWSQKRLATQVFLFLVTPSGTKKAYTSAELATMTGTSQLRVTTLLDRLSGGDVRILNRFETEDSVSSIAPQNINQQVNYEIYHDFLAQPILAWRSRQRLYQRLLIMQLFWLFPVLIVIGLWIVLPPELFYDNLGFNLIFLSILAFVPVSVAFFIGVAIGRMR